MLALAGAGRVHSATVVASALPVTLLLLGMVSQFQVQILCLLVLLALAHLWFPLRVYPVVMAIQALAAALLAARVVDVAASVAGGGLEALPVLVVMAALAVVAVVAVLPAMGRMVVLAVVAERATPDQRMAPVVPQSSAFTTEENP